MRQILHVRMSTIFRSHRIYLLLFRNQHTPANNREKERNKKETKTNCRQTSNNNKPNSKRGETEEEEEGKKER